MKFEVRLFKCAFASHFTSGFSLTACSGHTSSVLVKPRVKLKLTAGKCILKAFIGDDENQLWKRPKCFKQNLVEKDLIFIPL